jgi:hypothetical protein
VIAYDSREAFTCLALRTSLLIPYILVSNPHPFYSFRGLKGQMRIRIECGLDSQSRAGFWPNDRAGVRAVRTIQGDKNEVRVRFENIRYVLSIAHVRLWLDVSALWIRVFFFVSVIDQILPRSFQCLYQANVASADYFCNIFIEVCDIVWTQFCCLQNGRNSLAWERALTVSYIKQV